MKRVLLLPILAMGLMVSQAWGAACSYNGKSIVGCEYPSGCFELTEEYTNVPQDGTKCRGSQNTTISNTTLCKCNDDIIPACKQDGKLYSFTSRPSIWTAAPWGENVTCSGNGGTLEYSDGCNKWCQYDTGCNEIKPDPDGIYGDPTTTCAQAEANCPADKTFTTSTCSGSNPNPPNPPPGGDQFCNYGPCELNPANQYGCLSGGCYALSSTGCEGGTIVSSCPVCNLPPGNRPAGSNCGGDTPIIVSGRSVGLTIVPNGNILHIISDRNATVELFSMTGAKVFSSKVAAGNSSISLEKQRQGVYYAVVKSGSQKQTVKVVLK
ncbi:MAG: T9SS type A sorting domain-containing protein [Fibromonadaceae bacterium]|nr:T9SS type A sorting domain-containing protein [Fibromonadaceae bacterium]